MDGLAITLSPVRTVFPGAMASAGALPAMRAVAMVAKVANLMGFFIFVPYR